MEILLIEPFFTGSHQRWAEEYQKHSAHQVQLLTMKGKHWKWRMHGGAVIMSERFRQLDTKPDLILATDMLDVAAFKGLCGASISNIPIALYFHENQLTYPWSPMDQDLALKRDNHYAFINFSSALAADQLFFNSPYHMDSFLGALPTFLKQFPDYRPLQSINTIQRKSQVLPLGMDLKKFKPFYTKKENKVPVLLWNHRWEYDKNPETFFNTLFRLSEEGHSFQLNVVGASFPKQPPIFQEAKERLHRHLLHFGYQDSFEAYAKCIYSSDLLPVTSRQDFFGGSVVEAMYCGVRPLLPQRLAYPMHIPDDLSNFYFYANEDDFYKKVETYLKHFPERDHKNQLPSFVEAYDWTNLAPRYDKALEQLLDTPNLI